MRIHRKSPFSANFTRRCLIDLPSVGAAASLPCTMRLAAKDIIEENKYNPDENYLPMLCRVRLYDRNDKLIYTSRRYAVGGEFPQVFLELGYYYRYVATCRLWTLEVDTDRIVPFRLRSRAVRAEVVACPDVPRDYRPRERVIKTITLTPWATRLLLPVDPSKDKKSKRTDSPWGRRLRLSRKNCKFALAMKRKYDKSTLTDAVADAIRRHSLLDRGDRVIVALSGGADSVALLSVLTGLGYDCVAAHCNFHLRGDESQRDMRHVEDLCRRLGVDLIVKDFDVAARQAATGESVEMACRSLRYEWFDSLVASEHARAVAVGHHCEDSVETILLNMMRGTGIDGLLGIRYKRDCIIRPMLACSREKIEEYLAAHDLTYVTDSSNLSDDYQRNFVRNRVLPLLLKRFPGAVRAILATAANLQSVANIYHKAIAAYRDRYLDREGHIDIAGLVAEAGDDAPAVLREFLKDIGISFTQCRDIVASAGKSGLRFEADDGIVVELDRGVLTVSRPEVLLRDDVYPVRLDRDILQPVDLRVSRHDIAEFRPVRDPDTIYLDASALDDDRLWTLRRWRLGDRIRPFGMKGSRLVSDLFAEAHYSAADKRNAWLLTCGDEVVWVVGLRASALYPVTPETRDFIKINYKHKNTFQTMNIQPTVSRALSLAALVLSAAVPASADDVIISTDAYTWRGDTIIQGEYRAWAPSENQIVSTYHAQPGYYMGIESEWNRKNDLSAYPALVTPNRLHTAIYNLGLDEMVNAVEPDTTLRTGAAWGGVWTRDVSYSIILSMAYMQPEASMVSLMKKVNANGRIIQDTGSGGAWPVSSDRMIWAVAAYEIYKVTGDKKWLKYIYPIIKNSLYDDTKVVDADNGLVQGETSFIDWREQSYPRWMQTADIYQSQALGTSVVHAQAWKVLSEIAAAFGDKKVAADALERHNRIAAAVNTELWMPEKGYYAMYNYGRQFPIVNPRAETLGEALAIIYGIADHKRAVSITENNPTTPFGVAIFFPQIADMPPYHNNALWPWVAAYWAIANAKAGNEEGTLEAIGSIYRPAALFATNKENFVLDNGDIATQLNSSNMLWCLAGNIAVTHKILFGIHFDVDGLTFAPFVPEALAAKRSLTGFRYRDAVLDINISGYGDKIKSFKLNGKEHKPFIPSKIKGKNTVEIVMADNKIEPLKVNRMANVKAPLTPIAWIEGGRLKWNPIEYINHYVVLRDGQRIAETRETSFALDVPGEYQVIGVADDGTESFASEPRSNAERIIVQMPGESTRFISEEIFYEPTSPIAGYTGAGFVEIDHKSGAVDFDVDVPADGLYAVSFVYANGNGSVNTENKCAIRTLAVDGSDVAPVVMPQRGEGKWSDWGRSSVVRVPLKAGSHRMSVVFRPENENMNLKTNHALIDRVELVRIK